MDKRAISDIWDRHWRQGYGSVNKAEAAFIRNSINRKRPKRFLEIGTASGLSGGLISRFLSETGAREFVTIDFSDKFWAEPDKATGFLLDKIHTGSTPAVIPVTNSTSLSLSELSSNGLFDGAFIDANHQHPWPTLDTIATLPCLQAGAELLHHDLELYKKQPTPVGIGPKYLFDQIDCDKRYVDLEDSPNIFLIRFSGFLPDYQKALADSLLLPWTTRRPIASELLDGFGDVLQRNWGSNIIKAFDLARTRYA